MISVLALVVACAAVWYTRKQAIEAAAGTAIARADAEGRAAAERRAILDARLVRNSGEHHLVVTNRGAHPARMFTVIETHDGNEPGCGVIDGDRPVSIAAGASATYLAPVAMGSGIDALTVTWEDGDGLHTVRLDVL